MKNFLTTFLILLTTTLYAQDTLYFDKHETEVKSIKAAHTFQIIKLDSLNKNRANLTSYFKLGSIQSSVRLVNESSLLLRERKSGANAFFIDESRLIKWMYDGMYNEWYRNGKLKKEIEFKNGKMVNKLITYWPNGEIRRNEAYDAKAGALVGDCFDANGKPVKYTPYFKGIAYNPFEFRSVQSFVNSTFNYSDEILKYKVAGKVQVYSFFNTEGQVYKNVILKGLHPILDQQICTQLLKIPIAQSPATTNDEPSMFMSISTVVINSPAFTIDLFENAKGNDTIFYDKDGFVQPSRIKDGSMEILTTNSTNSNELIQRIIDNAGNVISTCTIDKKMSVEKLKKVYLNLYVNSIIPQRIEFLRNRVLNGNAVTYYKNGVVKSKLQYVLSKLHGEQQYFASDGTLTNKVVLENGKLLSGSFPDEPELTQNEKPEATKPQFPGGERELNNFLYKNLRYPVAAQEKRISGKIVLRFLVDTDGSISDIELFQGIDVDLNNEAIRVLKLLPNFIPATIDGVPVPALYSMPFTFRLL